MKSWNIVSMLTLAGALVASPAYAVDPGSSPVAPDGRLPQSDSQVQPGVPGGSMDGTATPVKKSIEGRITAVDRESGRFVLDTSEGSLSFVTSPEELVNVKIGDMVRVSLVMEENE